MSNPPPPPGPPPQLKSAEKIPFDEKELNKVDLKKVEEKDKHYVTLLDKIQEMEEAVAKDQQEHFQGFLDKKYQKEYFDEPKVLEKKSKKLAKLIRKSKHFVIFTGAGISTSAGIPDFRSPEGEWTLAAEGRVRKKKAANFIEAFPTFSHMALVSMQNNGMLKYLISQNCDGIHVKSGIERKNISELHGNVNVEICEEENCENEYYRDWSCRRQVYGHDHFTGRYCYCGGRLLESTVDFNQSMPINPLRRAYSHTKKCDLMLVLGSSCQVHPAAGMPEKVAKRGKLVIVNIQKTPLYDKATINIHGKIDEVMKIVVEQLKLDIPRWEMVRHMQVERLNEKEIGIQSLLWNDENIYWCTMFRKVCIEWDEENSIVSEKEPFVFEYQEKPFTIVFYPEKHFGEPLLRIDVTEPMKVGEKKVFKVSYDPFKREWKI